MKEFAPEIRGDVEDMFAGKLWAYVAVIGLYAPARLGVAVANEGGYNPIPEFHANGSYPEMSDYADRLNLERGLNDDEAIRIICSSMAKGKVKA